MMFISLYIDNLKNCHCDWYMRSVRECEKNMSLFFIVPAGFFFENLDLRRWRSRNVAKIGTRYAGKAARKKKSLERASPLRWRFR